MKDLTEAELIEIEQRQRSLQNTLDADPERLRLHELQERFNRASWQAEDVAQDVATLCEHLRAVLPMAAKDTAV